MSVFVDDPGDHRCNLPVGERRSFDASLMWCCDVCGRHWRKRPGTYGWEPTSRSSRRWRKAAKRRLEAQLRGDQS